jgi:long-subunit acyl-CoA synthetase (AMP-forming)
MLTLRSNAVPTPVASSAPPAADWISTLLHAGDPAVAHRVALATPTSAGCQELTYAGLDHSSAAVAAWLVRRGVAPGQRVLLQGDPSGAWVSACLGILRAGAIAVPLDPRLAADEWALVATASTPVAVVVAARMRPLIAEVGLDVDVLELESLDRLVPDSAVAAFRPGVARAMDDPAFIVWTSGTTGRPKGVTLTYANLAYAVSRSVQAQGLDHDDRWLSVLPLNHLLELTCGLLGSLSTGATLCFCPTLMPHEIVELLVERRITRMMVVPLLARLLKPELERARPGHLRALFSGGAPLAPELVDAYEQLGIPLYQGYGMTETAPTVAMNADAHHRRASVGRPLPGTEVRIERGSDQGGDADGEILVRSPAVMAGYWNDDALTREAIDADGWLHTGDLGHLDGDGFLFVTGRAKDLIVLESGKKVQPDEIEAVLQDSACFADVCVVGVASIDGRSPGSEQVCAVVVPARPMTEDEARAEVTRLSAGLSGYKRPRVVDVWDTDASLPRTAKRSVRRTEVARQASARLSRRRLGP